MKQKNNSGFSGLILLLIVGLVALIGASAYSYYTLKGQKSTAQNYFSRPTAVPSTLESVSESDEIAILEAEIDDTKIEEIDEELQDLNSQAASL